MEVVGYDPFVREFPAGISPMPLKELVQSSDFITVHVPLNDTSVGLLSAEHFAKVKPGAVLVNTSRGAVLDERALLNALQSGRLGAAGLDVLSDEPAIERSPLLTYARTHDNLIITPHCGGFSHDAVRIVCRRAVEKIIDHLKL